jgi:hypothetical protein
MNENELSKNEVTLKIHAGGTGLVLFLSISLFFWVGFLWVIKDKIHVLGERTTYDSFIKDFVAGLGLCIFFSIIPFVYWKFNFIELKSNRLIASVLDRSGVWNRSKASIWPKFIKTNIALGEIKTVSLNKTGFTRPIVFEIIDKNNKTYHIDTKPFSKVSCCRFIKELEKKGIAVDVEIGAI